MYIQYSKYSDFAMVKSYGVTNLFNGTTDIVLLIIENFQNDRASGNIIPPAYLEYASKSSILYHHF